VRSRNRLERKAYYRSYNYPAPEVFSFLKFCLFQCFQGGSQLPVPATANDSCFLKMASNKGM